MLDFGLVHFASRPFNYLRRKTQKTDISLDEEQLEEIHDCMLARNFAVEKFRGLRRSISIRENINREKFIPAPAGK